MAIALLGNPIPTSFMTSVSLEVSTGLFFNSIRFDYMLKSVNIDDKIVINNTHFGEADTMPYHKTPKKAIFHPPFNNCFFVDELKIFNIRAMVLPICFFILN